MTVWLVLGSCSLLASSLVTLPFNVE